MERSGGVTASAVLVFVGSGFTLLASFLTTLAIAIAPIPAPQPRFLLGMMIGVGVFEAAFAVWGIVSGIGILRLREWARISMLIFSGILLFFTVPGILFIPFLPMLPPQTADVPASFPLYMKVFLTVCYAIPAAIGAWWLYFFSKRSVKDQFRGTEAPATPSAARQPERPLSIAIIAWVLIISSLFLLPSVFMHVPIIFLGLLITGLWATVTMLAWSAVQFVAGLGLLKLRPWGWTLSICYFSLAILNVLLMVLVPHRQARLDELVADIQARVGLPIVNQPVAMLHFFFWVGVISGLALVLVQLWFVVTRRQAFYPAAGVPSPLT